MLGYRFALAWALFVGLAWGQPQTPDLLIGHGGDPVAVTWEHPVHVVSGYVRVDARPADGVVAQAYVSRDRALVDVFNVGAEAIRIAFVGVESGGLEFDRVVDPGCGIAWSSSPPSLSAEEPGSGKWDQVYAPQSWEEVDDGWTFTTGSPRNRFFSPHVWRAERGGVSRAMEAWLDRWVRWQLMRSYQSADPLRGFPRSLVGLEPDPHGGGWVRFEGMETITPMDTHHQTVGVLRDAYLLTGNPRALDQLARELSWAYATQDYYRPDWHWPYGGAERVPGWLLVSLADAAQVYRAAGLSSLVESVARQAEDHVRLLEEIGFNELGLPRVVAAPDAGRHIGVPFNAPWQGAIVAFGLLRVDEELGVPGARELAERWLDYLEDSGWDGVGVVFDSIPHRIEDAAVLPRAAGVPGVGMWLAPPLILGGREESPLLDFLLERARAVKIGGHALLSPGGSLSWFGPVVE